MRGPWPCAGRDRADGPWSSGRAVVERAGCGRVRPVTVRASADRRAGRGRAGRLWPCAARDRASSRGRAGRLWQRKHSLRHCDYRLRERAVTASCYYVFRSAIVGNSSFEIVRLAIGQTSFDYKSNRRCKRKQTQAGSGKRGQTRAGAGKRKQTQAGAGKRGQARASASKRKQPRSNERRVP